MKQDSSIFNRALVDAQVALYGVAFALTGDDDTAMSILQETNAALLRRAEEYDVSRPLLPLFKQFTVFQVRAWRKKQGLDRLTFDEDLVSSFAETLTAPDTAEESFAKECDLRFLDACMQKVPPKEREMLEERYYRNRSVKELAEEKRVSEKSLAVWMFRIRQAVKRCIEKARKRFEQMDTDNPGDVFIARLESFLDGTLSAEGRTEFCEAMKATPSYRMTYLEHAQLSAALRCRKRELFQKGGKQAKPVFRVRAVLVAAAALALLAAPAWMLFRNTGKSPSPNSFRAPSGEKVSAQSAPDAPSNSLCGLRGRGEEKKAASLPQKKEKILAQNPQRAQNDSLRGRNEKKKVAAALPEKKEQKMKKEWATAGIVAAAVLAAPPKAAAALDITTRCTEATAIADVDSRVYTQSDGMSDVDSRVYTEAASKPCLVKSTKVTGTVIMLM